METPTTGTSWNRVYHYDQFGNRAVTSGYNPYSGLTPTALAQYNTNNQWTGLGSNPATATYDAGGNQLTLPMRTFTYDAENRLVSSVQPGMPAIQYVYDGLGKRVQKTVGTGTTTFVYDAAGEMVAEVATAVSASGAVSTQYLSEDMLGSVRLITDSAGAAKSCYDYFPFGEDVQAGLCGRGASYGNGAYPAGPDVEDLKFTGKERDAETGLDFFGARYMASAQGRFTSPDKPFADQSPEDPQSWNLYGYVRNNPLKLVDPDGESATLAGAVFGGIIGGAVAAYRGQDIATGALKGLIAGAVAGSVIDTGGASLGVLALSGAAGGVTGGALDRAFAGQQTTLSDVGRDAAVGAVAGAVLGQAAKVVGSDAVGARDAVAASAGKGTATVIGAYDAQTGGIAVGRSGAGLNPVNPQVAGAAQRAGGLGARNPGVRGAVGNCAECNAANQLTNQGSNVGNVRFTPAVHPRTGEIIPKCQNCEVMFPKQ